MSQGILGQVHRRHTFAIISHPDAGKVTLTEKLLLFSGAIQSAGTVRGKKTGKFATSDWMEIEKRRGISVASSVMQFGCKNRTVDLLDTPGRQDSSEDTYRALAVVDSVLMVINAAEDVETRTIKLLNVCHLRSTPVVTFINKYDREVRGSLELLDEVENILKIRYTPITWLIDMGRDFKGMYHILNDEIYLFEAGGERLPCEFSIIGGIDSPELEQRFLLEIQQLRDEVELVQAASNEFNLDEFLAGELAPVFFGSAINSFGIQEILGSLIDWASTPKPRDATMRMVESDKPKFSGFIFKIQTNMDPKHHDRIAFLRVCSGKFERGMKTEHLRINHEIAAPNVVTFMLHDRELVGEAYASDIIGIPDHRNIQIGDSFSEGGQLAFTGIPFFTPRLFRSVRVKNPLKIKQLQKGLQQLGEKGAVQVFKPMSGADLILGAVGVLRFGAVTSRLANEYGVKAIFDNASIWSARQVSYEGKEKLAEFEKANAGNLAIDTGGNLAYLAPDRMNLGLTQEHWPDIVFHEARECSVKL